MNVNSLQFLGFVFIVWGFYFCSPKNYRWFILLLASYIFYFLSSQFLVGFIVLSSVSIYLAAKVMNKYDAEMKTCLKESERQEKKNIRAKFKQKKRKILIYTLIINIGFLAILKYSNFLIGNINGIFNLFGSQNQIALLDLMLPLGISYYTLQAISYIVDVYRGKYKAETNFWKINLYLMFFPSITEGPIGRYDELGNQLYEGHDFEMNRFTYGIWMMLWGFFKKVVIADRCNIFVNDIFGQSEFGGILALTAIALYTLQIYAEFSGCMDIVRGVSHVLGINLPKNFERPFFSRSINEFWRRWHITLGAWLKDYVFYSVSLSKVSMNLTKYAKTHFSEHFGKFVPVAFSLFFVWFGNGIWHGASWKYIVYGLYYYVIMMVAMLLKPYMDKVLTQLKVNTESNIYRIMQMIRTTGFVMIGMMLFRSSSIQAAIDMFMSIFMKESDSLLNHGLVIGDFVIILIGLLIIFVYGLLQEKGYDVIAVIQKKPYFVKFTLFAGFVFIIIIFGIYGIGFDASEFIYGQF